MKRVIGEGIVKGLDRPASLRLFERMCVERGPLSELELGRCSGRSLEKAS